MSSKYREDILRLKSENKTHKEIAKELNISMSLVGYHTKYRERIKEKRKNGEFKIAQKKNEAIVKRSKDRNRKYVQEYLASHPCVDCGNSDIRVLEFDHVRGTKITHIAEMVKRGYSLEKIVEEIAKCEVRCCNCHRIVTIERRSNNIK